MFTVARKRQLSDAPSDSGQEPRRKVRKTTPKTNVDDNSDTEVPTATRRPHETLTKHLLSTYRKELTHKSEAVAALEAENQRLATANASLAQRLDILERSLAQVRAANNALAAEAEAAVLRLPENQGTLPAAHVRRLWRRLEVLVAGFADAHCVDRATALPAHFAHLTPIPGPLLGACRPTRALLFQAWLWRFLCFHILARDSTFWAGEWGRDAMERFDEEMATLTRPRSQAERNRQRAEEAARLLTLIPASKAEQIHELARTALDFLLHDLVPLRRPRHRRRDISFRDMVDDLKRVLGAAAELDLVLRRSEAADYAVEMPSAAGFLARWEERFDARTMKVARYRDAGDEVVLVASPVVFRRGWEGEADVEEMDGRWRAAVKAKVVVGRGEREGEGEGRVEGVEGWLEAVEDEEVEDGQGDVEDWLGDESA